MSLMALIEAEGADEAVGPARRVEAEEGEVFRGVGGCLAARDVHDVIMLNIVYNRL